MTKKERIIREEDYCDRCANRRSMLCDKCAIYIMPDGIKRPQYFIKIEPAELIAQGRILDDIGEGYAQTIAHYVSCRAAIPYELFMGYNVRVEASRRKE